MTTKYVSTKYKHPEPLEELRLKHEYQHNLIKSKIYHRIDLLEEYWIEKVNREYLDSKKKVLWFFSNTLDTDINDYINKASIVATFTQDLCLFENHNDNVRICLSMPTGSVEKRRSLEQFVPFSTEELKYLDSIGFQLTKEHQRFTDQKVEDWIYDDNL